MSFITALGTGAMLADKLSGFIFNYTKSEYEEKINEVNGKVQELQNHLNDMMQLRSQISHFWEDDNAQDACRLLDATITETTSSMQTAKELMDSLRVIVESMDSQKSKMSEQLDMAKKVLFSFIDT